MKGINALKFLLLLLFASCIMSPGGDDSADCGTGEVFDHITRTCSAGGLAPQPQLRSISIPEDEETVVELTYVDVNDGQPNNCSVGNPLDSNVSIYSPLELQEAGEYALKTANAAILAANAMENKTPYADRDTAITSANTALEAAESYSKSATHSQRLGILDLVISKTNEVASLAANDLLTTAQTLANTAENEADELSEVRSFVANRCFCSGGTCSTVIQPAKDFNGTSGFSYSLSDPKDGSSDPVEVAVTVTPVNDAPFAHNFTIHDDAQFLFEESATSTAETYSFIIPEAEELDTEDQAFTNLFKYELVSAPSKGTLTNCMGINGSLDNDRECDYIPNDGNEFSDETQEQASAIIEKITFYASGFGTWGNDVSIQFVHQLNIDDEPVIVIDNTDITIYIEEGKTTVENVVDALEANDEVKTLLAADILIFPLPGDTYNKILNPTPPYGVASYNPADANELVERTSRINLAGGVDGQDSFTYRVFDYESYSKIAHVDITIKPKDDPPVIDVDAMTPLVIDEDEEVEIIIEWFDAENEIAGFGTTGCSVTSTSANPSFELIKDCECASVTTYANECKFTLQPKDHFYGEITDLEAVITTNGTGVTSLAYNIPITVNAVNDVPFPTFFDIEVAESEDSQPLSYSFSIPPAVDVDIPAEDLSYSVVDEPLNGTLTDCLGRNGSDVDDLDCIYTPAHGNLTGESINASRIIQDLRISAVFGGTRGEDIFIEYILDTYLDPGEIRIENDELHITVYIPLNITAEQLADAINDTNENIFVPMLIEAEVVGDPNDVQVANPSVNLVGGVNGMDFFTYTVTDGVASSSELIEASVNINVLKTNDKPIMCAYSKFSEANECGLLGCIGDDSPVGNITPSTTGVIYYHKTEAVCFKSTGTTNQDWTPVESYIPDQAINEKDVIVIDKIKIDEGGGDPTEDGEQVRITDVDSSDDVLVPIENIRFYYNDIEKNNIVAPLFPITLGSTVESIDSRDFRIEIIPVGGLSGESEITLTFQDTNATPKTSTVSFTVTVNAVSASHKGWIDIKAVGPKVNKHSKVLDHEYVCSYSRTKCTVLGNKGQQCIGAGSPTTLSIQADETRAVFYDMSNENCYVSEGYGSSTTWKKYNTYCSVSPSEYATECTDLGASCVGDGVPNIVPTEKNHFYLDKDAKQCYRSTDNSSINDWEKYDGPGEVTLKWEDFLISGSGSITGFNVYRRLPNEEFDYDSPINRETITLALGEYVDNEINSWFPPLPATVYFYEVKPIINGIPTQTNEVYKTIRVTVPPKNMAFVHRWIANKTMCDKMHAEDTDPTKNYRCKYIGPGGNNGYYDFGEDLIVDRYEISCNFSPAPTCDTAEGSCIGNFDPHTNVIAAEDSIFYNREDGKCYINTDGGFSWSEIDETTATIMKEANTPENPPLAFFDQLEAARFCASSTQLIPILGIEDSLERHLPTRKQQVAYSQWDNNEFTDTTINNTEAGLSLNSSSKCNTASASGLSNYYSDTQIPDSNTYYSLPGSANSDIRSVMTGSYGAKYGTYGTEICQSKYKIQDAVGNLAEWSMDRITCESSSSCSAVLSTDANAIAPDISTALLGTNNDLAPSATYTGNYDEFSIGNISGKSYYIGPCSDTNADDICDSPLTNWKFEEERFGSSRMIIPMGLPVHEEFVFQNEDDDILPYLFEIGPTSGITSSALHDDAMKLNTADIYGDKDKCGAIASGGGYQDGSDAGAYSLEVIPCSEDTSTYVKATLTLGDVSFRSISNKGENIFVNFIDPVAANQVTSASVSGSSGVDVILGTDAAGDINATAQDIVDAVSANGSLALFVEASVSGSSTKVQGTTSEPIFLSAPSNGTKRSDVGFRCVSPISGYEE